MNRKNVLILGDSCPEIGYYSRPRTYGKEYDMVCRYVDFLVKRGEKNSQKNVAIFIEPQIASGYPDLVIVEFFSEPSIKWSIQRKELGRIELQLLYFIQVHKRTDIVEISERLGFPENVATHAIHKLEKCGLIRRYKNFTLQAIDIERYCRIKKVISVEAKIDKWKEAIRQAESNLWFSTESYILLNKEECSQNIKDACSEKGIGIILVNGTIRTELASVKRTFPVSYASLQFNEWLQYMGEEKNNDMG